MMNIVYKKRGFEITAYFKTSYIVFVKYYKKSSSLKQMYIARENTSNVF